MAQLTWRDIAAPNFAPTSNILRNANSAFDSGVQNLQNSFRTLGNQQSTRRNNAIIDDLAGVTSEADVSALLKNLPSLINSNDISPAMAEQILGLQAKGMGFDTERLTQDGIRARTANTQASGARASDKAAREEAERAALKAAGVDLTKLQDFSLSSDSGTIPGIPAQTGGPLITNSIEGGGTGILDVNDPSTRNRSAYDVSTILAENPDLNVNDLLEFQRGLRSEQITSEVGRDADVTRDQSNLAIRTDFDRNVAAFNRGEDSRVSKLEAIQLGEEIARTSVNPEAAIIAINDVEGLTPEDRQTAIDAAANRIGQLNTVDPLAPAATSPVDTTGLNIDLGSFDASQAALGAGNTERLLTEAENIYADGNSAVVMANQIPNLGSNPASVNTAIKDVMDAIPDLTPARAAMLVQETVYQPDFGNLSSYLPGGKTRKQVYVDSDAAIKMGREFLSSNAISDTTRNRGIREAVSSNISALKNNFDTVLQNYQAGVARGLPVDSSAVVNAKTELEQALSEANTSRLNPNAEDLNATAPANVPTVNSLGEDASTTQKIQTYLLGSPVEAAILTNAQTSNAVRHDTYSTLIENIQRDTSINITDRADMVEQLKELRKRFR